VAEGVDGSARGSVQHHDLGRYVAERALHPLALADARGLVVGGERGVDCVLGVGCGVERDDDDARVARLLDRVEHSGRGVRSDQDALDALADHVLDGRNLTLVVTVERTRQRDQLGAVLVGLGLGGLAQLHEVRIRIGLGDQADLHAVRTRPAAGGQAENQRACHEYCPDRVSDSDPLAEHVDSLVPDATPIASACAEA
jgi:hypothetical protein